MKYRLGWTEEDQVIWRNRKMPAHTILYRHQHHKKEFSIMLVRTMLYVKPSQAEKITTPIINLIRGK